MGTAGRGAGDDQSSRAHLCPTWGATAPTLRELLLPRGPRDGRQEMGSCLLQLPQPACPACPVPAGEGTSRWGDMPMEQGWRWDLQQPPWVHMVGGGGGGSDGFPGPSRSHEGSSLPALLLLPPKAPELKGRGGKGSGGPSPWLQEAERRDTDARSPVQDLGGYDRGASQDLLPVLLPSVPQLLVPNLSLLSFPGLYSLPAQDEPAPALLQTSTLQAKENGPKNAFCTRTNPNRCRGGLGGCKDGALHHPAAAPPDFNDFGLILPFFFPPFFSR